MKKTILLFTFFVGFALAGSGQTTIRFVAAQSLKSTDAGKSAKGRVEQKGTDFSQEVHIILPHKTLRLQFSPGSIKQYSKIYTSDGEIPSQVQLLEATDRQQKYYLTTISNQFHGLLIREEDGLSVLERGTDSFFTYQKVQPDGSPVTGCVFDSDEEVQKNSAARVKSVMMPACLEYQVAFVCDYRHYLFNSFDVSKVEADNMLRLATTQEVFSPYAFKAEIVFKAVGHMVYTNDQEQPWTTDADKPLSEPATDLLFYRKPAAWDKYRSLVVAGITGINFMGTLGSDMNIWGYTKATRNEFGMGSFIIKGYLDGAQSRWIFAHEMGHIFGARHDGPGFSLMQPYYSSTNWSTQSKQTINETLDELDQKKMLRECPKLVFTFEPQNDKLAFQWKTNYDDPGDLFITEYSTDEQKSWNELARTSAKGAFTYELSIASKVPLSSATYYRVRQEGTNEIVSNVLRIIITATENVAEAVKIYPNPFMNRLEIQLISPADIVVFNAAGRRMLATANRQSRHSIETSSWPAGAYFIQAENSRQVIKVIK